MKINRIIVENYKPVEQQELELHGCSAIITAGNNKGKTSVLTGLIDRFYSEKPDIIVKEGEKKGSNSIELTDGSRIEWHFTQKSERFNYITPDGIKQTTGVIGAIGERYFGKKFDIDQFLNATPKKQTQWLQRVADIDLTEINQRYQQAYDDRTEANQALKRLEASEVDKPEKVEKPNIAAMKEKLQEAKESNTQIDTQRREAERLKNIVDKVYDLVENTIIARFFDDDAALKYVKDQMPEENYIDTVILEQRLEAGQEQLRKYDRYEYDLEQYEQWREDLEKTEKAAKAADKTVKEIEAEKQELLANADIPEGFEITDDGLHYNGYPLTENQISESSKYIAALKLGERVLGEVETMHFNASSLDRHSLDAVFAWAQEKDLQLLIERPDFEGGEIQYELILNQEN